MRLLWGLAGAAAAAGAVMTIATLRDLAKGRKQIERGLAQIAELRPVEQALGEGLAAKEAFDALPAGRPAPLAEIAKRVLPECRAEEGRETSQIVAPGWVLRRKEISLGETPLARAMEFVREAAAQRPPWVPEKLAIRASPGAPGTGQVVLVMEALERN
jgi:hypothetical protein